MFAGRNEGRGASARPHGRIVLTDDTDVVPALSDLTNRNLRAENEDLRSEIAHLREQLADITEVAEKNYGCAKKYRSQSKILSQDLEEAMARLSELTIENDKLVTDGNAAAEDLKMLKLQLEAAHATHLEGQTAWNALQSKNRQMTATIDAMNEQLDSQRREVAELCEGRSQCLRLIETMHKALCHAESKIGELAAENQRLKSVRVERVQPEFRLCELNMPFKDELGEKVEAIWRAEALSVKQKLQMTMDEAAKAIEKGEEREPVQPVVDEEELRQAKKEAQTYKEILGSLVAGLKQLAANEASIEDKAICAANRGLQQFLALHALDVECFKDCLDTRFISFGILGPENEQNRIEIVKQISEVSAEADAFVSAVLIVNDYLNKEVKKLAGSLTSRKDLEEAANALGITDLAEIPDRMKEIRKEVAKLVAYKKKLRNVARQLQKDVYEKESELSETSLRLSELASENEQLKCQLQIAENKQVLGQPESPNTSHSSYVSGSGFEAMEEKIQMLESSLAQKEDELQRLKEIHAQSSYEAEVSIQQLEQRAHSLSVKLDTIQQAYQQLKVRDLESKDRYKKKVHTLNKQHVRELNEQRARLQEAQQLLNTANAGLQERITQTNLLSKQLAESLAESEKRNQLLNEEVTRLSTTKQTLEGRLKALEEKSTKEKQVLQAQATARILAAETQIHEASTKEKSHLQKQITRLTSYIVDELGSFYGVTGAAMDDESCHQLLIRAKADLYKSHS